MIHAYHRTTIKAARAAREKLIRRALMLQQLAWNFVISAPRKSPECLSKETPGTADERFCKFPLNITDIIIAPS